MRQLRGTLTGLGSPALCSGYSRGPWQGAYRAGLCQEGVDGTYQVTIHTEIFTIWRVMPAGPSRDQLCTTIWRDPGGE